MANAHFGSGGGRHGAAMKPPVKAKNAKGTAWRLLGYLKNSRRTLVIVFLAGLIGTLITILGTRLNGIAVDNYIATGDMRGLAWLCGLMIVIYLVNIIATYCQSMLMIRVAQKTSATLRRDIFFTFQHLPLAYFDRQNSGDLMSRITNDVDNINVTLSQSVTQLFTGIISLVGMFLAMLFLNPLLTATAMLVIPMTLFLTKFIIKRSRHYFKAFQQHLGTMNGYIEEIISGEKVVILFNQDQQVKAHFAQINEALKNSYTLAQTFSAMGPFMSLINNITYLLVTLLGAYLIITTDKVTVGVVFTFLLYMRNFARPLNTLAGMFNTLQSALAGAERVFEVLDQKWEADALGALPIEKIQGYVVAEDVSFAYKEEALILKHSSFEATAGETVAIVGPTGAGKTTIISLLNGFYAPTEGKITIDGQDITQVKKDSLRKSIGVVLQDTFLFSESIADNIRYGKLTATNPEVVSAAKMANAHGFIMQLENGYDTILSDNGQNISHGQRQLLAIARAILSNPPLLILDEATSSIDTRSEVVIQKALQQLMEGRTSFVIAHRLSTIKNADQILVVNNGEIIERGNHQALLAKNGFYAHLYNSQFTH